MKRDIKALPCGFVESESIMKVFLTGGTGFVGKEIMRQLIVRRHSVTCLVRNPDSPSAIELKAHFGIELVRGDVTDRKSLDGLLERFDAVIHLVGIISEVGDRTFGKVHTGGTKNMVEATVLQRAQRFIFMSALGTRPNAVSRYHQTKWAAEEWVRNSGMQFTIFRPSLVYGPEDKFVNLFAKIIRCSPIVPLLGRATATFQPVSVTAVANAFAESLTEPRSIGQTYDLTGPETLTLQEIVDQISIALHKRRLKVQVPGFIARFQAALLGFIYGTLLRKEPPLNRDQLLMLEEDNVGNGRPANELFALQHPRFQERIASYLS
jgi:uncharacterized protein YbjT (DUF2867 family)